MRAILFLLFVGALVVLFCTVLRPGADKSKVFEFLSVLTGSSHSVEKEQLIAFVPPKGNFRVSFPGKPGILDNNNAWLHRSPLPLPHFFVADQDLGYYASSWAENIAASTLNLNSTQIPKVNTEEFALTFATAQSQSRGRSGQSNNDLVAGSVDTIDPIEIQKFLDSQCDSIAGKFGGVVSSKTPLSLRGGAYPGRVAEGTFGNSKDVFRLRLYLDQQNKRMFCVCVVGKPKRVFSAQATRFLDSLDVWS
jgi:hypothetical protein